VEVDEMSDCEYVQGCLFFADQLENMPSVSELLKKQYCRGSYTECARYKVLKAVGRERVPTDLFPQHGDRAEVIIAGSGARGGR
jgi:hypothetical protein